MRKIQLLLVCATMLAARAYAQSTTPMPGMEHHHHYDAAEGEREAWAGIVPHLVCRAIAGPMERGIALLHSFGYTEAQMQFSAIAKDDPACAMAHWGIAMTQFHELWGAPNAAGSEAGRSGDGQSARAGCSPSGEHTRASRRTSLR